MLLTLANGGTLGNSIFTNVSYSFLQRCNGKLRLHRSLPLHHISQSSMNITTQRHPRRTSPLHLSLAVRQVPR